MVGEQVDQGYAVSGSKDGDFYDNCPNPDCGTRDVELRHKSGGVTARGEQHHDWAMYCCPNCGTPWTRTTKTGLAHNDAVGQRTKFLTGAAAVDRTFFPSPNTEQYRDNYVRIFKHD